jgi:flagellar basal-body rod protein FlgG
MSGAFQIAAVGLEAQQRALDTIASNIANINTPAFRRSDIRFSELLVDQVDPSAARADLGSSQATSAGVRSDNYLLLDEQGRLETTGRAMDLAIEGRGFIELMGPDGQTLLWRGGTLAIGEDGQLGTAAGGLPLKAAITVPADAAAIEIGADGLVRARMANDERVEIGQIRLVRVDDPTAVERLDGGFYRVAESASLTDAAPGEDGLGRLVQGSAERSTVELSSEMVQMMLVQRAYAANAQIVQAADQLMALANGLRR